MTVTHATDAQEWDTFLGAQPYSPFLQSWTMGEVYRDTKQEPIRLVVKDGNELIGICQAIVVPARRGRHLAISYGPVLTKQEALEPLMNELKKVAKDQKCSFIRISPFWPHTESDVHITGAMPSPLHLLAEHIWYLPLTLSMQWNAHDQPPRTEDELMKDLRKTTRNLIRRAEKEGVTIEASANPMADMESFIALHEETRKRHHFTPYTNNFFRSQVQRFSERNECTLYRALYNGEVIASSVHMHAYGETSYHHGASTHKYAKIPASYLLQWTAITDAIKRGDHVYSFWGIAPEGAKKHPFKGVTTFKTGFGGQMLNLVHCVDVPIAGSYHATRLFELFRKWKRGF